MDGLESACENYGQAVVYRGSIAGNANRFVLDKHHNLEAGRIFPVCGNTWRMLHDSRFRAHFDPTSAGITACSRAVAASCRSTSRTLAPFPAADQARRLQERLQALTLMRSHFYLCRVVGEPGDASPEPYELPTAWCQNESTSVSLARSSIGMAL